MSSGDSLLYVSQNQNIRWAIIIREIVKRGMKNSISLPGWRGKYTSITHYNEIQ
jgi:hypothetical protein